ncbi:MAG: hypothetical protein Q9159_001855 [Coniocarpon cinnabarinum]
MPFAQLIVGAPGAGKSTYCDGMQQFMNAIERPCAIINLDPANDHTSYDADLDVRDLIMLDDIMSEEELGPNGGMLYAMEELEHNFEFLEEGLKSVGDKYILFDCPGQAELFTNHNSLRNVFQRIQKLGYRLVVVQLTDSYVLSLPSLYVSSLVLALRSMLQLELPHINVLTKIDNLPSYGDLPMPLHFYTEARSLVDYLEPHLEAEQKGLPVSNASQVDERDDMDLQPKSKFHALNNAILELVEDYGLVGFETLCVEDRQSMWQLLRAIDRAGGYAFGGAEGMNQSTAWELAVREGGGAQMMHINDVEERWITRRDELDREEEEKWKKEAEGQKKQADSAVSKDSQHTPHTKSGIKVVRRADP